MSRHAAVAAILLAPWMLLAACGDSSDDVVTPIRTVEIVTVDELEPQTRMTMYRTPGNEAVPLVSQQKISGVKTGQRILIYATMNVADTVLRPVPVTVAQAAAIPTGTVTALPADELARQAVAHFEILSQWQTGPWLNFQMKVRWIQGMSFTLTADASTLGKNTVVCRFTGTGLPADSDAWIDRRTSASFDVSHILTRPGQTVRIIP